MKYLALPLLFFSLSLAAQETAPKLEHSYWSVTSIETSPGEMLGFLRELQVDWRRALEMQKKKGKVLSYRIVNNFDGRDGEPSMWLFVEHRSAGDKYDLPSDYWQKHAEALWGSLETGESSSGKLHEFRSEVLDAPVSFN